MKNLACTKRTFSTPWFTRVLRQWVPSWNPRKAKFGNQDASMDPNVKPTNIDGFFWYCLVNVTLVNGECYDSNFHPLGPEAFALPCKLLMHGFLHSFGDNLNCMGDVNPMSPQLSCSSVKCLLTTCLSVPSGFIIGWSFSCQLKVVWHLTT